MPTIHDTKIIDDKYMNIFVFNKFYGLLIINLINRVYDVRSMGMRFQSYTKKKKNTERLLIKIRSDDGLIKNPKVVT